MFAQVDPATGEIMATVNVPVDDVALAEAGRVQIEVAAGVDGRTHRMDMTQDPPVPVLLPPEEHL